MFDVGNTVIASVKAFNTYLHSNSLKSIHHAYLYSLACKNKKENKTSHDTVYYNYVKITSQLLCLPIYVLV